MILEVFIFRSRSPLTVDKCNTATALQVTSTLKSPTPPCAVITTSVIQVCIRVVLEFANGEVRHHTFCLTGLSRIDTTFRNADAHVVKSQK